MARTPLFRRFIRLLQQARRENLQEQGLPAPIPKEELEYQLSRRNFMQAATLASVAGVMSVTMPSTAKALAAMDDRNTPKVAIVGAGLAGLNAAYRLKKAGIKATIYEASNRVGGRVFSYKDGAGEGLITELGAEFINTDHKDILALTKEFNLELFNRVKDTKRFDIPHSAFYFEGKQFFEAEVAKHLRLLAKQIAKDAELLDQDYELYAAHFDKLSVTDYLNQHADKIPQPYIRRLIANSIRTEYGVEPSNSSALQLLFNLPTVNGQNVEILGQSDEAFTIKGGNSRLTDALASALKGQIQTGHLLKRVQVKGGRYRLQFQDRTVVTADIVILAIPFTVLRGIPLLMPLPEDLRACIHQVGLGRNEKIIAGFKNKVWRKRKGFVTDAWSDAGFAQVWDSTQRQVNRKDGALTFYVGGRQVSKANDSAKTEGRKMVKRLSRYIPEVEAASNGRFLRTRWTKNPFSRGAYTNFKPGQLTKYAEFRWIDSKNASERQEVRIGNVFFVGEHVSDEYYGFMNGAAQTGRLAASAVLKLVKQKAHILAASA